MSHWTISPACHCVLYNLCHHYSPTQSRPRYHLLAIVSKYHLTVSTLSPTILNVTSTHFGTITITNSISFQINQYVTSWLIINQLDLCDLGLWPLSRQPWGYEGSHTLTIGGLWRHHVPMSPLRQNPPFPILLILQSVANAISTDCVLAPWLDGEWVGPPGKRE